MGYIESPLLLKNIVSKNANEALCYKMVDSKFKYYYKQKIIILLLDALYKV